VKRGKNQYTRDTSTAANDVPSPSRKNNKDNSSSPQGQTNGGEGMGSGAENSSTGKGRAKQLRLERMSMNELKRKANAMLEYISRTQIEMAGKSHIAALRAAAGLSPASVDSERSKVDTTEELKEFLKLATTEMMDVLSRRLVLWQQDFAS